MDQPPAQPPRLPERYVLWPDPAKALLGRGGAGEVWRAKDQALGVLVALKVLRAEGARVRARLGREAALAAGISHPNVVALHDLGDTPDGDAFVAFALASDGSLLDTAGHPPPWPELLELLADLLHALGALHARGLLHLDVKLSNLLLHRSGPKRRALWLADLGIARALYDEPDDESTVLGTVSYMASERLTGQRQLWGPPTDLFSVGAITWRLVTGQLPFPAKDPVSALASRRRPPTHLLLRPGYAVPAGLDEVLSAMLAFDRRARFDLAADALRALRALPELSAEEPPDAEDAAPRRSPAAGGLLWNRPKPLSPPESLPRPHLPRRVPQAPAVLTYRDIPLIGRDPELAALWEEARAVATGQGPRLVHIVGPRGIGRTRLVQEFTRVLEQEGLAEGAMLEYAVRASAARGLRGAWRRIAPMEADIRLQVDQLAGTLARDRGTAMSAQVDEASAVVRWLVPRADDPLASEGTARSTFVDHLSRRAWRGLSWLWLEDLHLADDDDDAFGVLEGVLARRAPVLVLITSREEVALPRLSALAARGAQPMRTLKLQPLEPTDAAALVQAYLPLEPALTEALTRHAAGNPRYLRELLLHWVRLGALVPRPRSSGDPLWTLKDSAPPLPEDRHAFARERLAWALKEDPDLFPALLAVALAGRGTPESVLARVTGPTLNRLVVAGLMTIERDCPVLIPPELPAAVRAWPRPAALDSTLHTQLAHAWAREGDDPDVLLRIGTHFVEAQRPERAVEPLGQALQALRRTQPVPETARLAEQVMEVARALGERGTLPWARAAMAMADASWRAGDAERARALDDQIAALSLPPEDAVRAASLFADHLYREDSAKGLTRLSQVASLLPHVPPAVQADFYAMRGRCRNRLLDDEGALEDFRTALSLNPEPQTQAMCHHYRAMLFALRGQDESLREAQRAIDIAHTHGLVRWEALSWTAAGEQLVLRGRPDEAIARLREAIAALQGHGEHLAAGTLTNNLGEILRLAGRDEAARQTYRQVLENPAFAIGDIPAVARTNLALMAAVERSGAEILSYRPEGARLEDDPTVGAAWAILEPLAELLMGAPTVLPNAEALSRAVRLGPDGVFLDLAVASLLEEWEDWEGAREIERAVQQACAKFRVDPDLAEPMLSRFRGARG